MGIAPAGVLRLALVICILASLRAGEPPAVPEYAAPERPDAEGVAIERLLVRAAEGAAPAPGDAGWALATIPAEQYYRMDWTAYPGGGIPAGTHAVEHRFRLRGAAAAGQRTLLALEQSAYVTRVLVDGREVAVFREAFLPLEADLTPYLAPERAADVRILVQDAGAGRDAAGKARFPLGAMANWTRGLGAPPRIRTTSLLTVDDPFVITRVDEDRLVVRLALRNHAPRACAAGLALSVRDAAGAEVLRAAAPAAEVPAGGERAIEVAIPCLGRLATWDLGKPVLYTLAWTADGGRPELRSAGGVRFGFRQVEVRGPDILLNGRRIRLIGPWAHVGNWTWARGPKTSGDPQRDLYTELLRLGMTFGRLHCQVYNERFYRAADETGLLIVAESALAHGPRREESIVHLQGLVRHLRNHPSIVLWSASNEFEHWIEPRPQATQEFLLRASDAMRALDPTRPIQHSGFGDALGRLDLYNIHYPEVAAEWPLCLGWLEDPALVKANYRTNFPTWDPRGVKPIAIGENWIPSLSMPLEMAYGNRFARAVRATDPAQRTAALAMIGGFWRDLVQYYRQRNVALLSPNLFDLGATLPNPFVEELARELKPVSATLPVRARTLIAGQAARLDLVLVEDADAAWRGRCRLSLERDGGVLAEAAEAVQLAGRERRALPLTLTLPAGAEGGARLVVRLLDEAGAVVYERAQEVRLRAAQPPALPAGVRLASFGAGAAVPRFLAGLGAAVAVLDEAGLDRLLAARDLPILVLGGEAPTRVLAARADRIAAFAAAGGRVLQLERQDLPSLYPLPLRLLDGERPGAAIAFRRSELHPVFAGTWAVDDADLCFWGDDLRVADRCLVKPAGGNVRCLVDAGRNLEQALVLDIAHGSGRFLVSQLRLAAALDGPHPAPRVLLRDLVAWLAAAPAPAPRRSGRLLAPAEPYAKALLTPQGWTVGEPAAGDAVLIGDQAAARLLAAGDAAMPGLRATGALVLHGLAPERRARLLAALGAPPLAARPWPKPFAAAGVSVRDGRAWLRPGTPARPTAWLDGITDCDLDWLKGGMSGDERLAPAGAWQAVVEPGLLCATRLGAEGGTAVLVDLLPWDRDVDQPGRRDRVLAALWDALGLVLPGRAVLAESGDARMLPLALGALANSAHAECLGDAIPTGAATLAGIPFRIARASAAAPATMLRLNGRTAPGRDPAQGPFDTPVDRFPLATPGPYRLAAPALNLRRLHVLHTATRNWKIIDQAGSGPVARFVLRYADGSSASLPVAFGAQVDDLRAGHAGDDCRLAGTWPNPGNGLGEQTSLFVFSGDNPHPERKLAAIEIENGRNPPHDLLILAITLEESAAAFE